MNSARWKWVSGAVAVLATATLQAQMPAPAVALSFSEASGNTTTNAGTLAGSAVFVQQGSYPVFTANVPSGANAPSANSSSVDFGPIGGSDGGRAIDLTTIAGAGGTLGAMDQFTIAGWLNARDLTEGAGGNRIAIALSVRDGPGFDLVQTASGALRIGINQYPDGGTGGPFSTAGKITADPALGANNWVFFAVTYDSAAASGNLKYYFGKPTQPASLDVQANYARGPMSTSGTLTVGNFNFVTTARTATGTSSRVFRGIIDELQIFPQALTLSQVQAVQQAQPYQPVDPPPRLTQIIPEPGITVHQLRQAEVVFSEAVQGVNASDLLIGGIAATNVLAVAPDDYVFYFAEPPTGQVVFAWAADHGIRDFAETPNDFAGVSWTNTYNPNAALFRPLISEFMAENKKTLHDEDGLSADWIEIYNPDIEPVNLGGYFLTDMTNYLPKWRFPAVVLPPNGYLVVFASEKNRTNPAAPLHTNFKLEKSGEYLALVDPATNVISQFAPMYPAQQQDVSYGRDRLDPLLVGYFQVPTPGKPNSTSGAGFGPEVMFSRRSGNFTTPFALTLSTANTNAVIRYLLVSDAVSAANTNVPGPTSPIYTNTLMISNTMQVRVRAFVPGLLPGPPTSETYLAVHTNVLKTSSDLPVVVLHTLGGGDFNQSTYKAAHLSIYEPVLGRTTLSNPPTTTVRAALRVRGNTSASSPKKSWSMETRDEFDQDRDVSLLDMPAESDWVLYGPNAIEPVMIHNPFAYELARRFGSWAPRTRFVEVYLNTAGGTITTANYQGLYVLMERIKIADGRVNEERLEAEATNSPAITGTYMLQVDRLESGETGLQIPAIIGNTLSTGGDAITYSDPKESELKLPQRASQHLFIRSYMTNFINAINSPNYADPNVGYAAYVNVDPSIDNHMVVTLCFSVDALNFSSYFYKARGGKITFGPIWDFDRSLESAGDPRDDNPRIFRYVGSWEAFDFFNYMWWGRMFQDTNFWQRWVDRYQQLRQTELSHGRVNGLIDGLVSQVRESQVRDVARWPSVTAPRTSYDWEVTNMKNWLTNRLHFFDTNFLAMPVLNTAGGRFTNTFALEITRPAVPANTEVYYTLDGSDPRLPGGGISPAAQLYSGPVVVTNNAHIVARSRNLNHRNLTGGTANGNPPVSTPWSGPARAILVTRDIPLVITEIMYHPAGPSIGNTNDADNFEFVELKNVGATTLDLVGIRFTNGIQYTFTTNSLVRSLAPGASVLLVKHYAAFLSRYPGVTNVAGVFEGTLDNAGERLALVGALGEPILDFSYSDEWYPITDGPGFSLVIVDETAPASSWGYKESWRPSGVAGGSPGLGDSTPLTFAPIVINEVLTYSDPLPADAIELHNPSGEPVDISGWFLTDDFDQPRKFRIPAGATIAAGGYRVYYQSNSFGLGVNAFALGSTGDDVYLFSGDAAGQLTGYVHGFDFGAQFAGRTFGRYVISTGEDHYPSQVAPSLGGPNAGPQIGPIVITEINYHPPDIFFATGVADNDLDEFIEVQNVSDQPVALFDPAFPTNHWRLRDAVDFEFPSGASLVTGARALVVGFDPMDSALSNRFAAVNGIASGVHVFGPWNGKLDNSSDSVELARPDSPRLAPSPDAGLVAYVLADKVRYHHTSPWPSAADGFGTSLQRVVGASYGNDPANWVAALKTPGAPYAAGPLPTFVRQPASQTNLAFHDISFDAELSSTTPLYYQWLFDGFAIPGGTNATLLLTNVQPWQAGEYSLLAWNSAGSVSSDPALLTLLVPATITEQPTNVLVRIKPDALAATSTNATFRVIATGTSPIRYQWLFNGQEIPQANASTLTITNVQASHWGEYRVTLTDDLGTVESAPAWLFPLVRPGFSILPIAQAVAAGAPVSVSVMATGWPPPFTFEWRQVSPFTILASNEQNHAASFVTINTTNVAAVTSYRAILRNIALPGGFAANFNITTLADTDADGVPDQWWTDNNLTAADAMTDTDGDGMLNWQEYAAGTNPRDPASVLRLQVLSLAPQVIGFAAASNKTYSVQQSGDPGGGWTAMTNVVARPAGRMETITLSPQSNHFYRVVTPQQ